MLARTLPKPDYTGGVSGQVHLLATALNGLGHDVTVYAQNPAPSGAVYDARVVGAPSAARGRFRSLYMYAWSASKLDFDRYDVIHTHGDDHLLRTRRPVVRTFYGTAKAERRAATRLRHRAYHLTMMIPEWMSERRATMRVTISHASLEDLTRPAVVIPCAYDPQVFFPSGPKSARPSILFVGDLGTRKRAELLLDAFQDTVRPAIPDAELWLVTAAHVSAPGVRWFGRVPTSALVDLYRRAWLFCLPSRYEGFGVPYIEALACGTPVVATPNGGAQEALAGGRAGRLVGDAEIGATLVEVLRDQSLRKTLARDGIEHARSYEIDRVADRYAAIYHDVVSAR
jgi:glycosyltransferase involved in cell wall biosynthesis